MSDNWLELNPPIQSGSARRHLGSVHAGVDQADVPDHGAM